MIDARKHGGKRGSDFRKEERGSAARSFAIEGPWSARLLLLREAFPQE